MTVMENRVLEKNVGLVRPTDIINEMQGAYLDYAMSVIVSRALPDVRDGLKPVHRRILYAMSHDLGLDHTKPHKKSARIVGEVLGKYHPHGDTAVYDAMVRMAQDFSLRYPLVDGQGNFGSVDGDNAAAMRYTEARLAEISSLLLTDLEKDTVDWHDNFDNSLREPDILPAALPNLLINGSSGIAVGMSTNVPPHNLREIVDALVFMIDNFDRAESITVEHLMQFVKGPDFPTGGIVYRYREDGKTDESLDVIAQGYSVGRGRLIVQAKAHFEEMSRNRSRIVVTELPYQTNKTNLLERIATLVRDGKLEGITDLRDESDRSGMRIVLELTRNVEPKAVLADLFKLTPLQQTFGMQMLALVDGEPRTLSLKRMLHLFIEHRQEIVRRRSEFELGRARERAHIVEGLLKALDILDEVIATIRRSRSAETARKNLMRDFGFTQVQAQAILDMQLRRLAAMERTKLKDEYKQLQARIAYLEKLLADPAMVLAVIKEDLLDLREKYGDARRTQIVDRTRGTLTSTDLLPQQDVWVSVGANGSLRRQEAISLTASALRQIGKNSEVALLRANTRDYLYLFNSTGQCRRLSIHELPYNGSDTHFSEVTEFSRRDVVTAAIALPRLEPSQTQGYLLMVTALGSVKRVTMTDFLAAAAGDPVVINVDNKDRLIQVLHTQGEQEVVLVSAGGQSIRFSEEDVRSMGLPAGGVGGMKLKKGDRVIYAAVVDPQGDLLTITEAGFAKRTQLDQYSVQGRYGTGIVTHKPNKRTGSLAAALLIEKGASDALVVLPSRGAVQVVALDRVPQMGRSVQGKSVVSLSGSTTVIDIKQVMQPPEVAGEPEEEEAPTVTLPALATNGANGSNGRHANGGTSKEEVKAEKNEPVSSNGKENATSNASASTRTSKKRSPARKTSSKRAAGADGSAAKSGGQGKKRASSRSSQRRSTASAQQSAPAKSSASENGAGDTRPAKKRRSSGKRSSASRGRSSTNESNAGSGSKPKSRSKASGTSTSRRKRGSKESTSSSSRASASDSSADKKASRRSSSRGSSGRRRTSRTRAGADEGGSVSDSKAKETSTRKSGRTTGSRATGSGGDDSSKPRARRSRKPAGASTTEKPVEAKKKARPSRRRKNASTATARSARASSSTASSSRTSSSKSTSGKSTSRKSSSSQSSSKAKTEGKPKAKAASKPAARPTAKPSARGRGKGKLSKVTSVKKRQVKKGK